MEHKNLTVHASCWVILTQWLIALRFYTLLGPAKGEYVRMNTVHHFTKKEPLDT